MQPRVVAIIQGRMGSSRLPGKILADIAGQPMLQRVFMRTSRAATVTETVFATTTDPSDDPVAEYCDFSGIPFSRGSLYDVLDRYYQAAKWTQADVVVRITADCPVIDPALIDEVVKTVISDQSSVISGQFDFAANNRLLFTGVSPRGFKVALLHHTTDFGDYRWTVDTPADLEFIRQVYGRFDGRDDFSWKEILDLVHAHPELMKINAGVQHKTLNDVDERATATEH